MSTSPGTELPPAVGPGLSMADLVAQTGTPASTVRYYISTGLMPPGRRIAANRFAYDARHLESLRLIRLLKERRRLPLAAIRPILPDLLRLPADGAFRPDMWDVVVETSERRASASSPAARLLTSGVAAFDRRGYDEVRVDEVCHAAGIAKGSFYRHFPSKEALFFAAARWVAEEGARTFAENVGDEPLSSEGATQLLVDTLEPHLPLLLDLISLAAQRRPGHGRVLREVFVHFHRTIRTRISAMEADERAEEVLERALVTSVRRVVLSPLLDAAVFPGAGMV